MKKQQVEEEEIKWQHRGGLITRTVVVVVDFLREGKVGRGSVLIDEDEVQPVDAKDDYLLI